jgi:hypothetical protein
MRGKELNGQRLCTFLVKNYNSQGPAPKRKLPDF